MSYVSFQVIKKRSPKAVCFCRCRATGNGTLILGLLYQAGWTSQRFKDQGRFVLRGEMGTGVLRTKERS